MNKSVRLGIIILFLITVYGCGGGSSPASNTDPVSNTAPVSNAGELQNINVGTVVTLNGSASTDANGDPLTYSWTLTSKPSGSGATLISATSATPTFIADVAGSYVATLVVNDGQVNSTPSTITVTATVTNAAPVANAGIAQNVVTGTLVTLNGSASTDANGDPLTYSWTLTAKPAGSGATLISATSATPTFTADVAGSYVATLVVNDGQVNSTPSTITVTATVANAAPVANAGIAQNVVTGTLVTLNGSASTDANGDPLAYIWTLTYKPASSTATLAGSTSAAPTFTADLAGAYVASLVVNDGKVNSTAATVTITATAAPSGGTTSTTYSVTAKRIGQNFYSIDTQTILQTKFCYEYAYSDSATLTMTASTGIADGTITFSNGQTCAVAGAYYPLTLTAGTYSATLTYKDHGFYSDSVQQLIVRSSSISCYTIRYYDSSNLTLTYGGVAYSSGLNIGTIIFSDNSTCDLVGIYGLVKLN